MTEEHKGPPRERELLLVRHRSRLLAGVCLEADRKTVRLETPDHGKVKGGAVRVPAENVLVRTGEMVDDVRKAGAWWKDVVASAEKLALEDVWELVREENTPWSLDDLIDLSRTDSSEAGPTERAALIAALESSKYFVPSGDTYLAASEAEIAAQEEAAQREVERAAERERFGHWLGTGEGEAEKDWLDRLKDVVLNGARSPHAKWLERQIERKVPPDELFRRLVKAGSWGPHEHLDLIREEVPVAFEPDCVSEAMSLEFEPLLNSVQRRDLRHLPVFTVDDPSSADLDDAISAAQQPDGSWEVGIHITDAASLVPLESQVETEARDRLTSLYFPETKIPMLPPQLSESAGSLLPDADRLAVSVLCTLQDGRLPDEPEIVLSVVRSKRRLSYDEADGILADTTHLSHPTMQVLYEAAEAHWLMRTEAGAITIDRPEWNVSVTEAGGGEPEVAVALRERNAQSQLLVSELMVYANATIARSCRDRSIPTLYRTQPKADLTDLKELEPEPLRRYRMLRKLQPASVSVKPGFHGALGLDPYCQASSPLRRHFDLVVQRQLRSSLLGEELPYTPDDLEALAGTTRQRLRSLRRMEGRRRRYWLYTYLNRHAGDAFDAVVVDTSGPETRVETVQYGIATAIKPEGRVEAGQMIQVKLIKCDPLNDAIAFVQVV